MTVEKPKRHLLALFQLPKVLFGQKLDLDALPVLSSLQVAQYVDKYNRCTSDKERYHTVYDFIEKLAPEGRIIQVTSYNAERNVLVTARGIIVGRGRPRREILNLELAFVSVKRSDNGFEVQNVPMLKGDIDLTIGNAAKTDFDKGYFGSKADNGDWVLVQVPEDQVTLQAEFDQITELEIWRQIAEIYATEMHTITDARDLALIQRILPMCFPRNLQIDFDIISDLITYPWPDEIYKFINDHFLNFPILVETAFRHGSQGEKQTRIALGELVNVEPLSSSGTITFDYKSIRQIRLTFENADYSRFIGDEKEKQEKKKVQ